MHLATKTETLCPPTAPAPRADLARGQMLGTRYVIEKAVGSGGCGTVFRAWDHFLGVGVALKVLAGELTEGPAAHRRLAREVRLARTIRHPNVCPVFGLECADGLTFLTMELARGSLADELAERDELPRPSPRDTWPARLRDAEGICLGLAAIHEAGIAHRDLKPQNVLRMSDGRVAIADFGIALAGGEGTAQGTPMCLPPEVIFGLPTDRRSDLWQLGLLLHELLLGERPTWRLPPGEPPTPVARAGSVPYDVAPLVEAATACLSLRPEDRPTSADVARIARRVRRAAAPPDAEDAEDAVDDTLDEALEEAPPP